jgi:hypothetical protein
MSILFRDVSGDYHISSRVLASKLATVSLGFGIINTKLDRKKWGSVSKSLMCALLLLFYYTFVHERLIITNSIS